MLGIWLNCLKYHVKVFLVRTEKDTKLTCLISISRGIEKELFIMKYDTRLMISWFGNTTIEKRRIYTNKSCTHMHWDKQILQGILYKVKNQPLSTKKSTDMMLYLKEWFKIKLKC